MFVFENNADTVWQILRCFQFNIPAVILYSSPKNSIATFNINDTTQSAKTFYTIF